MTIPPGAWTPPNDANHSNHSLEITDTSSEFRKEIFDACHILLTIITSTLTFFGNTLMVIVIIRTRSLHIPQGYMLMSIALADYLLGLESLVGFINVIMEHWPSSQPGCMVMGFATSLASTVNTFTLAFMSIDRWLVIHRPFHYERLMPLKKVILINAALWLVSIGFYLPFLFTDVDFTYLDDIHICAMEYSEMAIACMAVTSLSRIPSLVVITVFTVLTCHTAHTHAQRIHALGAPSNRPSQASDTSVAHLAPSLTQSNRSRKHIKTSLIIILTNTFTWLPLYIVQFIKVTNPTMNVPNELLFVAAWILNSSSYINWIICMVTDTNFFQATKRVFRDMILCQCTNSSQENLRPYRSDTHRISHTHSQTSTLSEDSRY